MGSPVDARPSGAVVGTIRLVGALSQGDEGIVYTARHPDFGDVLVKELFPRRLVARNSISVVIPRHELAAEWNRAHEQFREVGKRLLSISHDNVVRVRQVLSISGTSFWVMERVRGVSLAKKLSGRPLSAGAITELADQLSTALDVLHRKEVQHLDLTPDNVIIAEGPERTPVLVGFAAARSAIAAAPGDPPVSPGYTPPELYGASAPAADDGRPDIYSASAILWQALTGEPPPSVSERRSGSALEWSGESELLEGVRRGLSLDPEERPESVAAWRVALGLDEPPEKEPEEPAVEPPGPEIGPPPPPPFEAGESGGARLDASRRALGPRVLGVAFLAALVGGVIWLLASQPPPPPAPAPPPVVPTWTITGLNAACSDPAGKIADLELPLTVVFLDSAITPDKVIAQCDDALTKAAAPGDRARFETARLAALTAQAFAGQPDGVPDLSAIRRDLEKLDQSQAPLATYLLGLFHLRGWGDFAENRAKAAELFALAEASVPQAKIRLGELYHDGVPGVLDQDKVAAMARFYDASTYSPVAKAEHGRVLLEIASDDVTRAQANKLLDEALEAGVAVAGLYKARASINAGEKDWDEALAYLERAIEGKVGEQASTLKTEIEYLKLGDERRQIAEATNGSEGIFAANVPYTEARDYYAACPNIPHCKGWEQGINDWFKRQQQ